MKLMVLVLALLTAGPAFAYLDPGTGSMILQVVLGGMAAASVALKLYWQSIKSFFRRESAPGSNVADSEK